MKPWMKIVLMLATFSLVLYSLYHSFLDKGRRLSMARIVSHNPDSKKVQVKIGNKIINFDYSNPELKTMVPACDCTMELAYGNMQDKMGTAYGVWLTKNGVVHKTLDWTA